MTPIHVVLGFLIEAKGLIISLVFTRIEQVSHVLGHYL